MSLLIKDFRQIITPADLVSLQRAPKILDRSFIEKIRSSERVFVVSHLGYFFENFGDPKIKHSDLKTDLTADSFMDTRWGNMSLQNPKQYLYEQRFRAFFDAVKDHPILITVPYTDNMKPVPGSFWKFVTNYIASSAIANDNVRILPTDQTTGTLKSLLTRSNDYSSCLTRQLSDALKDKEVYAAGGAVNYCLRFSLLDLQVRDPRLIQGFLDYNPVWQAEKTNIRLRNNEKWLGNPYDPALDIFLRVRSPEAVRREIEALKKIMGNLTTVKPHEILKLN